MNRWIQTNPHLSVLNQLQRGWWREALKKRLAENIQPGRIHFRNNRKAIGTQKSSTARPPWWAVTIFCQSSEIIQLLLLLFDRDCYIFLFSFLLINQLRLDTKTTNKMSCLGKYWIKWNKVGFLEDKRLLNDWQVFYVGFLNTFYILK